MVQLFELKMGLFHEISVAFISHAKPLKPTETTLT